MKKLFKYTLLLVLALCLTSCSWYVKYPSAGVETRVKVRTEKRVVCRWVHVDPVTRVWRCKKVRVRIR